MWYKMGIGCHLGGEERKHIMIERLLIEHRMTLSVVSFMLIIFSVIWRQNLMTSGVWNTMAWVAWGPVLPGLVGACVLVAIVTRNFRRDIG